MNALSFFGDLTFSLAQGSLIELNECLLTKYLALYLRLPWMTSVWLLLGWAISLVNCKLKLALLSTGNFTSRLAI